MPPRRQAAPEGSVPPPSRPSSPGGEEIDEVIGCVHLNGVHCKANAFATRCTMQTPFFDNVDELQQHVGILTRILCVWYPQLV